MSNASNRRTLGIEKLTEVAGVPAFDPPDAFIASTAVCAELDLEVPGLDEEG